MRKQVHYLSLIIILLLEVNLYCQSDKMRHQAEIAIENVSFSLKNFSLKQGEKSVFQPTFKKKLINSKKTKLPPFLVSRAAPVLDLNGTSDGVDFQLDIQPLNPMAVYQTSSLLRTLTTDDGNIVRATITLTGLLDNPEGVYFSTTATQFNLPSVTSTFANLTYGTTTFRIENIAGTNVFNVEEFTQTNQLIPNGDFLTLLNDLNYFNEINAVLTGPPTTGARNIQVVIEDVNGATGLANSLMSVYNTPLTIVDDVNTILASSTGTVTGNVLTLGPGIDGGESLAVTEVNVYPAAVGNSFTTLYGSVIINGNGSYVYDVDEENPTITGLSSGDSIQDIIAYTATNVAGAKDYGILTITINGVDELPSAEDNNNAVTVNVNNTATGNVIVDPSASGAVDAIDRTLSTLVWENEFLEDETVGGKSRTINGVQIDFTSTDPSSMGTSFNQTSYNTGVNGGHTGYLLFSINPTTSPNANTVLTMDFDEPVYNLGFLVVDIDFSQGVAWQDQVTIEGSLNGVTSTYKFVTNGRVINAGSNTFYGRGEAVEEDATGNINVFFEEPIDQLKVSYNYGPDATLADPGGQIAGVSDIYWQDDNSVSITQVDTNAANVGVTYIGTYGTIVLNADGTYTYTVDSTNPAVAGLLVGSTLTETFNYTLSDTINTDSANLVITINGSATDNDNDGIADVFDDDLDNDGITNANEDLNCTGSTVKQVLIDETFETGIVGTNIPKGSLIGVPGIQGLISAYNSATGNLATVNVGEYVSTTGIDGNPTIAIDANGGGILDDLQMSSFIVKDGVNLLKGEKFKVEADFSLGLQSVGATPALPSNEFGIAIGAPNQDPIWAEDFAGARDAVFLYGSGATLFRHPNSNGPNFTGLPRSKGWFRQSTVFYVEDNGSGTLHLYADNVVFKYSPVGVPGTPAVANGIDLGAASNYPWLNNAAISVS
ncbi:MAG: VCBS domain-containing protein, partial [Tenacibaculum sp.]